MNESEGKIPLVGYAALLVLVLFFLWWQNGQTREIQSRIREATRADLSPAQVKTLFQQGGARDEDGRLLVQIMIERSARARMILKLSLLLAVVFPTAVLFPALMTAYEPPQRDDSKVIKASEFTRDHIDLGVSKQEVAMGAQSRLFAVNLSVFAVSAILLLVFPLMNPEAFGGLKTWLLFAVSTLMAFGGTGMAFPLKEIYGEPTEIIKRLGAGWLILAVMAFIVF